MFASLLIGSTPALADTAPACPPAAVGALWPQGAPLAADGRLQVNTPGQIALQADADGKHAGSAMVTIDAAGTYAVALGSAAWIDVVKDGALLTSTGHGHGPACSGIRKIVRFALQPGIYEVRLSRSERNTAQVLVSAAP
ncbi:MAG: hypothetical protein B7Y36_11430 [Novosphingobium sp. 28-62-57]|nr:MAG: hypothetical protein B7Z34_03405 [Novosphingobium sp. 12-62-10]OYZ09986.1 MAG: hypothetical protein B7Y36_11430 [Novosphingobium sp. 28-62-57]OZA36330.1 MAG: hypothetical protein B7X92_06785 [Novosphingobium sp. 17-62-9]